MKLLYFITKSEAGGAQTHVSQLSRHGAEQGYEIAIMSHPGGWLEKEAREQGWKFYPNLHLGNSFNPIRLFFASRKLSKALDEFSPDLVSCHSTVAGFIGRLTIRNRIPTLFTAHGWGFTRGINPLRRALVWVAEKMTSRWARMIICVSDYDKLLAKKFFIAPEEKLIRIHNGVELIHNLPTKHSSDEVKLLFVGRYVPQKDPMLLLQAYSQLASTRPTLQLTLIGGGPQQPELEMFVREQDLQNRVTVLSALPRKEVLEHMMQTDIFVLTSNWEGFPRSILEAMTRGVPVIATDVAGVKEAISHATGILIPQSNQEALVDALERLVDNPKLREDMGNAAHLRALEYFSLTWMYEQTFAIYNDLTGTRDPTVGSRVPVK